MTEKELQDIITIDESYRIERTVSISNMDKFQEAICAFANDLPGKRQKGYLLIGVDDNGRISGLKVDDALSKKISGIRSDGNILPLPIMHTEKVITSEGDVLVVEVTPSFDTPVRYKGRTFVRIGPRRDIATVEEERILTERCAAALPGFDFRPCRDSGLSDLCLDIIRDKYLPTAISPDILLRDSRDIKEQLASLHLYNLQWDCPTYASLVLFGKDPCYFMPGAYIQYVQFKGEDNGGAILNERRFKGCLYEMLPQVDNFVRDAIIKHYPVSVSVLREESVTNYPFKAIHELLMNAVMHRDYQSNMPIRLYQYDRHLEIMNPGGLYGQARPENFPNVNDYRNQVVAQAMKELKYVNMFNHGILEVRDSLKQNENPPAEYNVDLITAFSVVVRDGHKTYEESISTVRQDSDIVRAATSLNQLKPELKQRIIFLIDSLYDDSLSIAELKLKPKLNQIVGDKSNAYIMKCLVRPAILKGWISMTYPENPRHPNQKYFLTDLGKHLVEMLRKG